MRGLAVGAGQDGGKVLVVARAGRSFALRRQIFGTPNLRLKAGVRLADVVQSRQDAEPCRACFVQVVLAARAGQPFTDGRLFEQGFEAGAHIGKVVFEKMDARRG